MSAVEKHGPGAAAVVAVSVAGAPSWVIFVALLAWWSTWLLGIWVNRPLRLAADDPTPLPPPPRSLWRRLRDRFSGGPGP